MYVDLYIIYMYIYTYIHSIYTYTYRVYTYIYICIYISITFFFRFWGEEHSVHSVSPLHAAARHGHLEVADDDTTG